MSGREYHVETLYALRLRSRGPNSVSRIEYSLADSIPEIWSRVSEEKGISADKLRAAGWHAIKVIVQEV
jgi:hypothetical protein